MNRCAVEADEHRYQLEQEHLQRQHDRKAEDARRIERLVFTDAPSLEEALREEGDEALASHILALRKAPDNLVALMDARDDLKKSVDACVKRHVDNLTQTKFEAGVYADDYLPF